MAIRGTAGGQAGVFDEQGTGRARARDLGRADFEAGGHDGIAHSVRIDVQLQRADRVPVQPYRHVGAHLAAQANKIERYRLTDCCEAPIPYNGMLGHATTAERSSSDMLCNP